MILRVHLLAVAAGFALASSPADAATIRVASATYGTPAISTCDATPAVASQCDGRKACLVDVRNTRLCGDPDFLEVKKISISYLCGNRLYKTAVSEYEISTLACK